MGGGTCQNNAQCDHMIAYVLHSCAAGWHTHEREGFGDCKCIEDMLFDNYLSPRLHEKPLSKLVLQVRGGQSPFLPKPLGTKIFYILVDILVV